MDHNSPGKLALHLKNSFDVLLVDDCGRNPDDHVVLDQGFENSLCLQKLVGILHVLLIFGLSFKVFYLVSCDKCSSIFLVSLRFWWGADRVLLLS